ncbi:extracellular solute-binding protein [Maribius pontilimi]|uniref:Extracellular solute-binding protein n=1 Tax=Palleronia pontilimi TaxID=1964209 RepID=A0A934MFI0_9RHOB|nr:extracellular solute-binding protein [Palleronia pontilimi]MBJ3761479.1 extracellular solute-binding protein [Palleronia pontilimi]
MSPDLPSRRAMLLGGLGAIGLAGTARGDIVGMARHWANRDGRPLVGLVPDGSQANLDAVIADWTHETGIPVALDVVPVDDVHRTMTLGALSDTDQPDFALPATFNIQDLVAARIIASHDQIDARIGRLPVSEPGLYTMGDIVDGERYGLQTDGDVYLMFYRQDMLTDNAARYADRYGHPLTRPSTWPELDRQMAFFHRPASGQYGGALFRTPGYLVWEFWSRMHAKGHLPFDAELHPLLHQDPAVEALEQMIAATAYLHPATASAGLFENWRLFQKQDIYCNIGWGGSQKAFNAPGSRVRGKLVYSRLPGEKREHSSYFNWGWSYVVPQRARSPELGHLFGTFATSQEHSTPAVRAADGYFDPFHAIHYEDPEIQKIYSKPFLEVHKAALAECIPDLYLPGYGTLFAALSRALQNALSGRQSARAALSGASEAWQIAILDQQPHRLAAKWHALLKRYPAEFTEGLDG